MAEASAIMENMGLGQTLTSVNNANSGAIQGSHAVTATKTQAYQASHGDRVNYKAEQTMGNDEFNRNLQNQNAIFSNSRMQQASIDYDNDIRFEKTLVRLGMIDKYTNVDTMEAAGIRSIQDGVRANEIMDKMSQAAAGGKMTKAEMAMAPESGIAYATSIGNMISDQARINSAAETTNSALKIALAAVTQRGLEKS